MLKYIVKRILMLIPVLLGATFIVFTVMDMTPGDPAVSKLGVDATAEQIEELRESMGLNDPFLLRYGRLFGTWCRAIWEHRIKITWTLWNRSCNACHIPSCCRLLRFCLQSSLESLRESFPPVGNTPFLITARWC